MQSAAQAWLVRDLHREPYYLGLLSLSFALPMLVLTPLGGAIADRVSPRLLKLTQSGMMLQAVVLAVLTLGGWIQFWEILALSFLNAVLLAMDNPARQALLPDLVRRDQLPSAVSLSSVAWSGSALFGPALAGLLLGPLGAGGLFLINALSFLAVLFVLFRLRDLPREARQRHGSVMAGVSQGLRYVAADRRITLALLLLTVSNVLGRSYQALMPIFARDVLAVGPQGYGLLLAAPGAGALLVASAWPRCAASGAGPGSGRRLVRLRRDAAAVRALAQPGLQPGRAVPRRDLRHRLQRRDGNRVAAPLGGRGPRAGDEPDGDLEHRRRPARRDAQRRGRDLHRRARGGRGRGRRAAPARPDRLRPPRLAARRRGPVATLTPGGSARPSGQPRAQRPTKCARLRVVSTVAADLDGPAAEEPWPLAPEAIDAAQPGSYLLAEATLDSPPRSWVR